MSLAPPIVLALFAPAYSGAPGMASNDSAVFLLDANDHLTALEASSGAVRWTADASVGEALGADDKRVYAWGSNGGSTAIAFLDVNTGKRLLTSQPFTLPSATAHGFVGAALTIYAHIDSGALAIEWTLTHHYGGGKSPGPADVAAAAQRSSGTVLVDLASGAVQQLAAAPPGAPAVALAPPLASAGYLTSASWSVAPFVFDDVVTALALERPASATGDSTISLVRRKRDTGAALPSVVLLRGRAPWSRLTLDGHHLMIIQAVPIDAMPQEDRFRLIVALDSGAVVARLPYDGTNLGEALTVAGTRVVELGQGVVRAYDGDGRSLWEHASYAPPQPRVIPYQ
ncbi:MAG TPA: PQQ-binding-like beta-propeller repeat protein [Myxococcota bacterium]